jgi:hypothetical protein
MSAFRDFIRPFAEDFVWIYTEDPGQASEAVDTLAGAIEAWARNVFDYMTEINHSTFARIRDFCNVVESGAHTPKVRKGAQAGRQHGYPSRSRARPCAGQQAR